MIPNFLRVDPEFGRLWTPRSLHRSTSMPKLPTRRANLGELGIFVAKQHRAIFDGDGRLIRMEPIWIDVSANERVDAGASYQARQVIGGGASPAAPSASAYFNVIAVASATLTKAKGDQSLGSTTASVTTNEFTTIGLARAAAAASVGGDFTPPSSLGGTFSQIIRKLFTATGTGTAYGAALLNSTTVSGSIMYVEDNFGTSASLIANDTLTVEITITN